MTRSVAKRSAWQDEQGALLVLTAMLVPAIVLLGALTFGVTTLWTSHEDIQRAADLGSTVAAATTPTAAVTPGAATLPFPIDGTSVTKALSDVTGLDPSTVYDSGDWKALPCDKVALGELAPDRSAVTNAFKTADDATTCTAAWTYETPALAAIAACAGELLDVTGCAEAFREELARRIPAISSTDPIVNDVMAKADVVTSEFTNRSNKLVTALVAQRLPDACTATVELLGGVTVCTQTVNDLLSGTLGTVAEGLPFSPGGSPAIGVDLEGLLPAVLTPRVNMRINGARVRPTFSPFTFTLGSRATARRAIRSALVLPSAGIPYEEISADLDAQLGDAALELKAAAGVGGYVVDPNDLNRQAQSSFTDLREKTFALLDSVNDAVKNPIVSAFMTAACSQAVISSYCPDIDPLVAARGIDGQFVQDLRDATRPPPQSAEPTLAEILDGYVNTGDPLWVVAPLQTYDLQKFFGQSVWSVLTDPSVNPVLAPLLSRLMYIPALDVVPATIGRIVVSGDPFYVIKSIPLADTLAIRGLYQARLVK